MKSTLLALLALSAYAVASDNHHPTSTEDCDDEDEGPTSTLSLPYPTWGGPWTTSTVYSTSTRTVVSCGPEVKSCPAHSTVATTIIIPVSTTVCPVSVVTPPAGTKQPPPPPVGSLSAPPPPAASSSWKAPPPPASVGTTWAAPPAPTGAAPPAPTTFKATSVGTISAPKTIPTTFATAGANQNVQRAGGALAVALAAAALL